MRLSSPILNLCKILEEQRLAASEHSSNLVTSEAATRAVLIDPVLRALGWDISNPAVVEVEKKIDSTAFYPDYVLKFDSGIPATFVEAKRYGMSLSPVTNAEKIAYNQVRAQSVAYAASLRIGSFWITNGITWQLHDPNTQNNPIFDQFNLLTDDHGIIASKLVNKLDVGQFWPFTSVSTLESRVAALERLQTQPTAVAVAQAAATNTVAYQALDPLLDLTRKSPEWFRLPDGREMQISAWYQMVLEMAKYVLENNSAVQIPLPNAAGGNPILSDRPFAPSITSRPLSYGGRTIWVYLTFAARDALRNTLYPAKFAPNGIGHAAVAFS